MARKKKKVSKKKPGKSVAVKKSTLPANWRDQLREDAAEESERTPIGSGNRISLKRNGQFAFQGADIGDSVDLVIVDHCVAKTYYEEDYDEDNITPPTCFALKLTDKNIAPHPDIKQPEAEVCADCWANE